MKYIKTIPLVAILIGLSGCVPKEERAKPTIVVTRDAPVVIREEQPQPPIVIEEQPVIVERRGTPPPEESINSVGPIFVAESISSPYLQGSYGNNYKLKQFINTMVNKHHFSRGYLNALFSSVNRDSEALKKIGAFRTSKPIAKTTTPGAWDKYRKQFIPNRVQKGVQFWRENRYWLEKANYLYGVAPEYVIGIIGVETNFGGFTGKHNIFNALTSIALEFPKRSKYFTSELENYLLMTREQKIDPRRIEGSYAGAFGLSQFMPSSFREYAVDHDDSGQINLFTKADAIGSIANYFKEKGHWNNRIPVAIRTTYRKPRFYGIDTGFKTLYSQKYLQSLGMRPVSSFYGYRGQVSLIKLNRYNNDELWWGTNNFYAIARYNPQDFYAMAVHQLAQAVRAEYYRSNRR